MATKKVHDILKTKRNKIRRLEKELKSNPNNVSAQKALEFWKSHDRKVRK
jgi:hypothetical protein